MDGSYTNGGGHWLGHARA